MPDCRRELVEDETETDDPSVVGDEAHIVAREDDGPRGKSQLSKEDRDKYDNLILLCKIHHKKIDDQPEFYSIEKLHQIKTEHLDWVKSQLSLDESKINDEQIYASFIDKWVELAEIDNWKNWGTNILSNGQPSISGKTLNNLTQLNEYIFSRVWPTIYPEIEKVFNNFRLILNDFLEVFTKYTNQIGDGEDVYYITEKIYNRLQDWDPEKRSILEQKFDYHVELVQDLMLELTRSANLICNITRKYISKYFRLEEGAILVSTGPDMYLRWKTIKLEYEFNTPNIEDVFYKGLRKFMTYRIDYKYNFGEGISEDYFQIRLNY